MLQRKQSGKHVGMAILWSSLVLFGCNGQNHEHWAPLLRIRPGISCWPKGNNSKSRQSMIEMRGDAIQRWLILKIEHRRLLLWFQHLPVPVVWEGIGARGA